MGAARRILRDVRPDAVLGAGGYVAGPVGLAAVARRVPLVLAEADSHLGLTNRLLARWARRVCLAFPIAGRDGERYLRHRAPGAAARDRSRRGPRALRPGAGRHVRARLRRLAGRADDQRGGGAGAGRRRLPRAARLRQRATTRRCARGSAPIRRPTTTCASSSRRSARRCWPATCASRAPAARSSRSPPTGARRSSCPTPTRRPTTRARTRAGWPQAGAAVVVADAELTPERLAQRGAARCWAIARGWRRWDGRRRRWRGPTPLSGSPRRCSPPRRGERTRRRRARWPHRARAPR